MNEGFPELTDSFLAGQDIFYVQFNEIEFYVEDTDQEHFYFNILKKLFPDLVFEKIFPLNGKDNVQAVSLVNIGNKKKVFIVDLDFDAILGKVIIQENLFYIKKYSIENYLLTKDAIYEIIRSRNSKLKNNEIDKLFNYKTSLTITAKCLTELSCSFIVIQKYGLGIDYYGISKKRDFDLSLPPPSYRMNFVKDYLTKVEIELKKKNRRLSLASQIRKFKGYYKGLNEALSNIPGKYLLNFIKDQLQSLNLIHQMSNDSFVYNLSKEVTPNDLGFLKNQIISYIK